MVIVTIDSDYLSGKLCFEKQIRVITIVNDGAIVDAKDMKDKDVKKLELEVQLPDGKKMKYRPNQTAKKSLVKLFGPDTVHWNGKKIKLVLTPYQDSYSILVDELDTKALNEVKGQGTL